MDRNLKTITGSRFCQVALRTEGVDRNSLADAKILSDAVALRTEGVDRNLLGPMTRPLLTVALRTETVYSKKYFRTLKIEYSAQSVRSTESELEMLAPGWPLWPERFRNDPRKIP